MLLVSIPIVLKVDATSSCVEITYYAKKEWVDYFDFIDTEFNVDDKIIVNSKAVSFKRNVFGTLAFPQTVHHASFDGTSSFTTTVDKNIKDPNFFHLEFGKSIRIGKIKFKIEAKNKITGENVNKKVYINGQPKYDDSGTVILNGYPIYESDDNDFITIDLKYQDVTDIEILFDQNDENEYTLHYFQIIDYKVYETVGWTRDVIDGVETRTIIGCSGDGKYESDGTKIWVKEATTLFSPSVSLVSDYVPILEEQATEYDWGRGTNISPYAIPTIIKNMGGNATYIRGFTKLGIVPYITYESFGRGLKAFPYIMIDDKRGVQYVASANYWSPNIEAGYLKVSSNNRDWCYHVIGSYTTPCYKHVGHSANTRWNSYDVNIRTYTNLTDPKFRVLSKTEYYLVNEDTKEETFLKEGIDEVQTFAFTNTGRWRIKALLYDLANNVGTKISNLFLIDKEKPNASFSIKENEGKPTEVTIAPSDKHSGVKRWKIELSTDAGVTFNKYSDWLTQDSEKLLLNSGEYQIKVDVEDNAGNINTITSNVISVQLSKAVINSVIVPSYDLNVNTPIYMVIECIGCETANKEIGIYYHSKLLSKHKLDKQINKIQTSFNPNDIGSLELSFQIQNETVTLKVMEKTREFKESDKGYLEFDAIVASAIDSSLSSRVYNEKLILSLHQDKKEIMSGEGIDLKVNTQYQNECSVIQDFECKSGIINDIGELNTQLNTGQSTMTFKEGASLASNIYLVGSDYVVPVTFNNNSFLLPRVYLDKKTGITYVDSDVSRLDGGNKWYSNPRGECQEYPIVVNGNDIGFNRFAYRLSSKYAITHHYYDDFRIHFSEPKDPFKNGLPKSWEGKVNWFNDLDLTNPIKQVILDKK